MRGWKDFELTPEGRELVKRTAVQLEPYEPKYIYHSDFMRDSETAHIIGEHFRISPECDFDARTWDVGLFSGQPEAEANQAILELYKNPWRTPPGSSESFNIFSKRWVNFLENKMDEAANIPSRRPTVIVTHGRNIALTESHINGTLPWESDMSMPAGFSTVNVEPDRMLNLKFITETEPVLVDY